jgi:hypothetical protein
MVKEHQAVKEVFFKGNADALDEVFATDAVFHAYPSPDFKALDMFKQFFHAATSGFQFIGIDRLGGSDL